MKAVAVYNFKGGVGKTAASVNLAYESSRAGRKTLLWDLDPQGASSFYFRIKPKLKVDARRLLSKSGRALDCIKATDYENLDLLPADLSYREMDLVLDDLKRSRKRFGPLFEVLAQEGYDRLFVDCPPGLTLVSENAMLACDLVTTPVIPTPLSLRAYEQMLKHARSLGVDSDRFSAFFSMVDRRKGLHRDVIESFGALHRVLPISIPYLSSVERMGIHRQPVAVFDPGSPASQAYRELLDAIEEQL